MSLSLDYKQLAALDAVVREQSFDKAARRLHITQSAVSQRLAQLELSLGQRVVTRSLPMRPTPPGEHLLSHARQVALMESELERRLNLDAGGYTVLSVAVSDDTLAWFVRACMTWMPQEPHTLLQIYIEDESRTQALMRNGSVLGCISQQPGTLAGGEVTPLGAMRFYCVATPGFATSHFPHGLNCAALEQAPAVLMNHDDPLHGKFLQLCKPGFDAPYPFHLIPSMEAFIEMIDAGAGYGLVSASLIGDRLKRGILVDLAPQIDFRLPLYWHRWALPSPLIARLTDALVDQVQRLLEEHQD